VALVFGFECGKLQLQLCCFDELWVATVKIPPFPIFFPFYPMPYNLSSWLLLVIEVFGLEMEQKNECI